jgi:hypothetical protein
VCFCAISISGEYGELDIRCLDEPASLLNTEPPCPFNLVQEMARGGKAKFIIPPVAMSAMASGVGHGVAVNPGVEELKVLIVICAE